MASCRLSARAPSAISADLRQGLAVSPCWGRKPAGTGITFKVWAIHMHGRPGARQQCPHLGLDCRAPMRPRQTAKLSVFLDTRHARCIRAIGRHAIIGRWRTGAPRRKASTCRTRSAASPPSGSADPLESVDVDQHHRAMPTPACSRSRAIAGSAKIPIGQAGQVVKIGQLPDTLLGRRRARKYPAACPAPAPPRPLASLNGTAISGSAHFDHRPAKCRYSSA